MLAECAHRPSPQATAFEILEVLAAACKLVPVRVARDRQAICDACAGQYCGDQAVPAGRVAACIAEVVDNAQDTATRYRTSCQRMSVRSGSPFTSPMYITL